MNERDRTKVTDVRLEDLKAKDVSGKRNPHPLFHRDLGKTFDDLEVFDHIGEQHLIHGKFLQSHLKGITRCDHPRRKIVNFGVPIHSVSIYPVGHAALCELKLRFHRNKSNDAKAQHKLGMAQLGAGDYASLRALAEYLAANPAARVALVGHTDATGALEVNIAISRRRAASVMERLASDYAVPRQQMTAEGMGWLAPLATNITPEGREANRRVEAVLLTTGQNDG